MLFEAKNLVKTYAGTKVVDHLSFCIDKGEIVGLLGPNGAGKTTAFYMAIGLVSPDEGSIFFEGNDVSHAPVHVRARLGMGYLAQEPSIFRGLSVEENILSILELLPISQKEQKERLEALLQELNLTPHRFKKAVTLSGGERRRLEITRSLVTNPSLLLLDEPFANIDPIAINDVKEMIRMLKKRGISVLITDHNAREIFSLVDRSYIIRQGAVMLQGTVDELVDNAMAREHYLGASFRL